MRQDAWRSYLEMALGLTEAQLTSLVLLGIGAWQLVAQRRWRAAEA